jgi:outer membrane protein TolC
MRSSHCARLRHFSLSLGLSLGATFAVCAADATAQEAGRRTVTLDEARALALETSWDIETAELAAQQAQVLEDQARALLRPTLNASASATLYDEAIEFASGNIFQPLIPYLTVVDQQLDTADVLPDPAIFDTGDAEPSVVRPRVDYRGSLTASYTLLNVRALPLIRQARATIDQAQAGVEATGFAFERAVVEAYFGACGLQRFIAIAERNAELTRVTRDRVVAAYEEGVGNRFEANRAEVAYSSALREVENARTEYELMLRSLALLVRSEEPFDVVEPAPLSVPGAVDSSQVDADRADLSPYGAELEFDEHRIREQQVRWIPQVYAMAQANLQRSTAFGGDIFSWNVGLTANWDIYDGGIRVAEQRSREYELVADELRLEQALEQARLEVERLELDIRRAALNVEGARADSELAASNVRITEDALEIGTATELDVEAARQQLLLSELAVANNEVLLQQKLYLLELLLGE